MCLVGRATSLFQHLVENVWVVYRHGVITVLRNRRKGSAFVIGAPWSLSAHDERRPFLPPMVNARLILLSVVGVTGLIAAELLPDRRVSEPSNDDWEEDLLRCSSARMSSKETLR